MNNIFFRIFLVILGFFIFFNIWLGRRINKELIKGQIAQFHEQVTQNQEEQEPAVQDSPSSVSQLPEETTEKTNQYFDRVQKEKEPEEKIFYLMPTSNKFLLQ